MKITKITLDYVKKKKEKFKKRQTLTPTSVLKPLIGTPGREIQST